MKCVLCYTNFYAQGWQRLKPAVFTWQGNSLCEMHYQSAIGYTPPTDGKDND